MDELRKLYETGLYVFHGSSSGTIAVLEPRQAYSHGEPDGAPCVVAPEVISPAVFMAVLGSKKVGGWGKKHGEFGFYINESSMQKAVQEDWSGYVYVLDRSNFVRHQAWEWRTSIAVKPIVVVAVGMVDLPSDIELV